MGSPMEVKANHYYKGINGVTLFVDQVVEDIVYCYPCGRFGPNLLAKPGEWGGPFWLRMSSLAGNFFTELGSQDQIEELKYGSRRPVYSDGPEGWIPKT